MSGAVMLSPPLRTQQVTGDWELPLSSEGSVSVGVNLRSMRIIGNVDPSACHASWVIRQRSVSHICLTSTPSDKHTLTLPICQLSHPASALFCRPPWAWSSFTDHASIRERGGGGAFRDTVMRSSYHIDHFLEERTFQRVSFATSPCDLFRTLGPAHLSIFCLKWEPHMFSYWICGG